MARLRSAPVLVSFSLKRPKLFLYGHAAKVSLRLRGRAPVRVRLVLSPAAGGKAVESISLGSIKPGRTRSFALTGRESGVLPQGDYVIHVAGHDARGRGLRRGPHASSTARLTFHHHVFPLAGAFSYGDRDSRFGAKRKGHTHQGQDLPAASGTPVVAPRGGTIETVDFQAHGAGHYVVLDGAGEDRDYVFMHLARGSTVVREGERVRTGQRIGDVGSTGESSGPHLHFEVWNGGWQRGHPVDPLPLLQSWNGFS
jgi:murein DD-endopeptidase MepM/ murein hydrolase activator NlpD